MMLRSFLAALILCVPLAGQDKPELPEPPEPSQISELRSFHGKYQSVVVHRLDVEPKATLIMKALRGDVVMMGTDVHRIVIEEKITVKTGDKDQAQEAIDRGKGSLSPPTASGEAYIFKVGKWIDRNIYYDYKVRVPRTFNVIIHSYGGDIDMEDLQGDLEAKTGGGDVALSNSAGKVKVHTGGGDIDVFKVEGQVDLFTGGGDIEGRTVEGKINASTGGGDIDFWTGKGNFTLNTGGGDITLRSLEGTEIEARTGGGEIDVEGITAQVNLMTKGGDICAEEMRGNLEMASSGGDLCLKRIRGDAILFTGSGDVEVRRITGAVRVNSGGGDIEIYEMTLEEPGKEESTFTTAYGDVYVNLSTEKPVEIIATFLGFSPRYAADHLHGNVDFTFERDNSNTIARYTTDHPFHRIVIETRGKGGEIKIMKGEQ